MDDIGTLLKFYLRGVWQRKWLAAGICWGVCLAGWIFVFMIPSQYQSQARVYINIEGLLAPLLRGLAVNTDPGQQLDYMHRTLLSRPNLEQVAHLADLDNRAMTHDEKEELLTRLGRAIEVSVQGQHLFSISYENSDPVVAKNVVQGVLTVFSESTAGNNQADMSSAQHFLNEQITNYEQQLRAAEARRAAFRAAHADALPDMGTIGAKLDALRTQVVHDRNLLADATARRDVIKKELASVPQFLSVDQPGAYIIANGQLSPAQTRLAEARRHLADLLSQYTEAYPDVAIARRDIATLEKQVADERAEPHGSVQGGGRHSSISNIVYEQLKLRLADQESTVAALTLQLASSEKEQQRLEAVMRETPGIELQAQNLDRDYNVIKKNYEELIARRESAHLAEAADVETDKGQFRIVDAPQVPVDPVAPNRPLLYSGVLIVGLAAGIGMALLLIQLDRSFTTIAGLRTLGLPVIGAVTRVKFVKVRRRVMREAGGVAAATIVLLLIYAALIATSSGLYSGIT